MRAPGSTAPLIHLLISALYIYIYHLLVYIICFPLILFSSLFPYLSFPLRILPLCFQAGGHKRRPKLGFFGCFSLFYLIVFVFLIHDWLCSVSLGLLSIIPPYGSMGGYLVYCVFVCLYSYGFLSGGKR